MKATRTLRRTHRHLYQSGKQGVLRITATRRRLSKSAQFMDIDYSHVARPKLTEADLPEYQGFVLEALSSLSTKLGLAFSTSVPAPDGSPGSFWHFAPGEEPRETTQSDPIL
jgi:hypothetical protein